MQISTTYGSSAYGALSGLAGQSSDEMDSKLSAEILKAKDADGSGSLSVSELGTSAEKLAEYDTDGDGEISSAELQAGLKARREKMQAEMQNQMMQNGQMGMLQASMGQGTDMSKMDSQMSRKIIDEKDTNQDGVLSAEELGVSAGNLSAVDSDGDGSVSESELTALLASHREEMMAENGGQMPPPPGGAEGTGGGQGAPSVDNLVTSLFGTTDEEDADTGSLLSEASTLSLAEYLQRQKASSSYMNMDRLLNDLFGSSDDTQSLSLSA